MTDAKAAVQKATRVRRIRLWIGFKLDNWEDPTPDEVERCRLAGVAGERAFVRSISLLLTG